jgi:hypothetical protein
MELFQLERTLIFLGEESSVHLFSMFCKTSPCHFGEYQELLIDLIVGNLTNIDQENHKSILKRRLFCQFDLMLFDELKVLFVHLL